MLKKNYRREEVSTEWNNGLKQKFNIKCLLDIAIFIFTCILFVAFAKINNVASDYTFMFITVIILLNVIMYFFSRQWFIKALVKVLVAQTETITDTTGKVMESANSQKNKFEVISASNKTLSTLLDKLKTISADSVAMSKNTEKQINQSIFLKKNMILFLPM